MNGAEGADSRQIVTGSQFGPYLVEARIGKGGMGEVYRAHDPRLQRHVAIKTSLERFDERFSREARAIAALNHPNICQIHDVGPDYIVMELVDGPTLEERIRQGPIPFDEAAGIAGQIADALAAAHGRHIVHRDLKPGNIKIKENGTVKVLDFGLAKIGSAPTAEGAEDSSQLSTTLTEPGVILGTAAYMSPEQALGKTVDARSDIWSFGVVYYEMLLGRRPFAGKTLTEILASVVRDTPDLSTVPHRVRGLIEACLQKDSADRLQDIGDRDYLVQREAARQRVRWLWPAIVCAATLVLAAVLVWARYRETPPAPPNLRYQLTRSDDSGFGQFQLSPDGRYLAFVARSGADSRLYIRPMDSLDDREVPGTDGTTYPFWSPDSAHIGFFSQGKLRQVAVSGGPATDLADAPDARGGAWGRDGSIIFAPAVTGTLFHVSASGGAATPMKLPVSGSRDSLRFPVFFPDSDRFFYTIESQTNAGKGIYVASLGGDAPVRILPDLSMAQFVPARGSDSAGFILFRRQDTLLAQAFDAANLKTGREALPLAEGVGASGNTGFADFTVSKNGLLIYAAGTSEREIVWLARDGKRGKSILKQKGITDFALSPDQTQLLYSLATQAAAGDLWLHNMASGASQRFTFGPSSAFSPVWSPDGAGAVFTVFPEDRLYARKTAVAGVEALAATGTNTYATSGSTDGKLLAFTQTGITTKDDLWLLPLEGGRKPRLFRQTPYSETDGQISPDGRWMAYSSDSSGRLEIYVEPLAVGDAPRQVSIEGGGSPRWRADGRELYFIFDHKMMAVEVKPGADLTFGTPHELFHEPALVVGNREIAFQPSADGSRFLTLVLTGGTAASPPLTVVTDWRAALKKQGLSGARNQ